MSELRVGVIGVGVMGADHADRLATHIAGAHLVAISDTDTARADIVAASLPGVRCVTDPLALIADPEIDAVLIASSVSAHEEQVLACIEHRKPTLCEKPLTYATASSKRLVEAEAALGYRLVQVGFMRRFDPEYAQMKAMLSQGSIGSLLLLHNVHRNREVPTWFETEMIVRDSMVHEVDIARFLFDEEITEITVHTPRSTSRSTSDSKSMRDPLVALFRMAGGAIVTNEVFVNSGVGYEVRCEAVGENGSIVIGQNTSGIYRTGAGQDGGLWGGTIHPDYTTRFKRAYDIEVQAWVDATRRGEVIGPSVWDGYAATVVCSAGVESLHSGQSLPIVL